MNNVLDDLRYTLRSILDFYSRGGKMLLLNSLVVQIWFAVAVNDLFSGTLMRVSGTILSSNASLSGSTTIGILSVVPSAVTTLLVLAVFFPAMALSVTLPFYNEDDRLVQPEPAEEAGTDECLPFEGEEPS